MENRAEFQAAGIDRSQLSLLRISLFPPLVLNILPVIGISNRRAGQNPGRFQGAAQIFRRKMSEVPHSYEKGCEKTLYGRSRDEASGIEGRWHIGC
jgi:hypothetical protein